MTTAITGGASPSKFSICIIPTAPLKRQGKETPEQARGLNLAGKVVVEFRRVKEPLQSIAEAKFSVGSPAVDM